MNQIELLKKIAQQTGRLTRFEAQILFDAIDILAFALDWYATCDYEDGYGPARLSKTLAYDQGQKAIGALREVGLWDVTQEAGDE